MDINELIAIEYHAKNPLNTGPIAPSTGILIPIQPTLKAIGTWIAMTRATMTALI